MSPNPFVGRLAMITSSSWPVNVGASVRLATFFGAQERISFFGIEWINTTDIEVWGVQSLTRLVMINGHRQAYLSNVALIPAVSLMLIDGDGTEFLNDRDREFRNEAADYSDLLPWLRRDDGRE